MKSLIFNSLVCSLLLLCYTGQSQSFTYHSDAPFGIIHATGSLPVPASNIYFFDYDFDGDQDLFQTGLDYIDNLSEPSWEEMHFFLKLQENIGNKLNPVFAPMINFEPNFPFPVGYFLPAPGDLNGDDITDFIVSADIDDIANQRLWRLIAFGGGAGYDILSLSGEGLVPFVPESYFFPHLVDLDQDGDLDLLMSGFLSAFGEENGPDIPIYFYARNIGNAEHPVFQGWYTDPYRLTPNPGAETLISGDIDNDGDIDLIGSTLFITDDSMSHINVHLNSPIGGKPNFPTNLESPFGLPTVDGEDQLLSPALVDIDGDGDLDFFALERTPDTTIIRYYENHLCQPEESNLDVTRCENDPPLVINGVEYINAGFYEIQLQGSDGCDSTVNLALHVIPFTEVIVNQTICLGQSVTVGGETFDKTGSYMILAVAANGCDSLIFLDLTVIPPAEEDVDATICASETYFVGTESFSIEGQYVVQLPAAGGCDSLVHLTLEVIEVDNTVSLNGTTLMANFSNGFYQWFNCDTGEEVPFASQQNLTPLTSGNYAVRITNNIGCTVTSECTLVIVTATEDEFLSDKIELFPNPASDQVYIRNESGFELEELVVMDLFGNRMMILYDQQGKFMEVSGLITGAYIAKIQVGGEELWRKLIIGD